MILSRAWCKTWGGGSRSNMGRRQAFGSSTVCCRNKTKGSCVQEFCELAALVNCGMERLEDILSCTAILHPAQVSSIASCVPTFETQ